MQRLLENRAVKYPEIGIVKNCPSGSPKSILPKSTSLSPSSVLMSAMCVVHVENTIPCIKKNELAAIL